MGAGNFGKVFLATSIADQDLKVAIKTISKKKVQDQINIIRDEIKILSSLDHANIIKYHETYESPSYIYLVMEYCNGGELFDKLTNNRNEFTDEQAREIMKSLFLAVNHCHSNGIAHRDLKPENILMGEDGYICLTDFGLAKILEQNEQTFSFCGTPEYLAPEILDE